MAQKDACLEPKWHNATLALIEKVVNRRTLAFLLNFDVHQTVIRDVMRVTYFMTFLIVLGCHGKALRVSLIKVSAYGSQAFPCRPGLDITRRHRPQAPMKHAIISNGRDQSSNEESDEDAEDTSSSEASTLGNRTSLSGIISAQPCLRKVRISKHDPHGWNCMLNEEARNAMVSNRS